MEPARPRAASPGRGEGAAAPVSAAISRARPKWLSRSPRFGVISTSRIVSAGKRSAIGAPTFASGDKINRPDALRRDRARSGCKAFLPTRRRAVCSFESPCRSAASRLEAREGLCRRLCNCRAQTIWHFCATPIVHFAHRESIRIRMTRGRGDLRNNHLVDVGAACLDVFGFDPGASQQFGDVFRIFWKIDKFAQPVNGEFHFVVISYRAGRAIDLNRRRAVR
jgi:hypothetical protein